MKMKIATALALTSVVACGPNSNESKVASADTHDATISAVPDSMLFSRDDRPVDGALRELKIAKSADGTYVATLHTVPGGLFPPGSPVPRESTETLGKHLICTSDNANFVCSQDTRPVDGLLGMLVEVKLMKGDDGTYLATLRKAGTRLVAGQKKPFDTTTEIGWRLKQGA